jgi:hypothetical protein
MYNSVQENNNLLSPAPRLAETPPTDAPMLATHITVPNNVVG